MFSLKSLDPSKGFASVYMNMASMKNNGIEVALSVDWFRAKRNGDFAWTTSATFAHNRNEVTVVESQATTAYEFLRTPYQVGYPASALWTYKFAGLTDVGQYSFYDANGEVQERVWNMSPSVLGYMAQTDPKVTIGLENQFRYKGFTLNIMMVYYGGHKMLMMPRNETYQYSVDYGTMDRALLDSWTPDNKNTTVPGFGAYGEAGSMGMEWSNLDIFAKSAAFLKIRNIVLSYDLPQDLTSKIGMNKVSVRFQVDNPRPLYLANGLHYDPETGGIRRPTSYSLGLSFNF
jgi:hypothetical protein